MRLNCPEDLSGTLCLVSCRWLSLRSVGAHVGSLTNQNYSLDDRFGLFLLPGGLPLLYVAKMPSGANISAVRALILI